MDDMLIQMVRRVQLAGGKNICEKTKKLLTAIWLYLRKDGLTIGASGRRRAQDHVKTYVKSVMKRFEVKGPYVIRFSSLEELKAKSPQMYEVEYARESAHVIQPDQQRDICYIDSLMRCRGSGIETAEEVRLQHEHDRGDATLLLQLEEGHLPGDSS